MGKDIYKNVDGRLPSMPGRKYYEVDVGYQGGKRGPERIVYSNDGKKLSQMTIMKPRGD